MTAKGLGFISDMLSDEGINYCFGQWNGEVKYPYFVGEYIETQMQNEDGQTESDLILTGFTNGSRLSLEKAKEKIRSCFTDMGITHIFDGGNAIAVMYKDSFGVPTGNDKFKSIQINLKVLEWSVN